MYGTRVLPFFVIVVFFNSDLVFTANGEDRDIDRALLCACNDNLAGLKEYIKKNKSKSLNLGPALFEGIKKENKEIVQYLLRQRVSVETRFGLYNWTPIFSSIFNTDEQITALLLQAGAQVDVQDKEGWTPLMIAVRDRKAKHIALLLENHADPRICNLKGYSAIFYVAANRQLWAELKRIADRKSLIGQGLPGVKKQGKKAINLFLQLRTRQSNSAVSRLR